LPRSKAWVLDIEQPRRVLCPLLAVGGQPSAVGRHQGRPRALDGKSAGDSYLGWAELGPAESYLNLLAQPPDHAIS